MKKRRALGVVNKQYGARKADDNRCKLDETQVREIRKLASQGFSIRDLALAYPVSPKQIAGIVNRVSWGWVLD